MTVGLQENNDLTKFFSNEMSPDKNEILLYLWDPLSKSYLVKKMLIWLKKDFVK